MTSVTHKFKDESTSELPRDGFFSLFAYIQKPSKNYCTQKTKMSRSSDDSFPGRSQRMFTKVNSIDKLPTDLAN